jgi:RsiW-degrading membrane proteinase PrsW (M82 family)
MNNSSTQFITPPSEEEIVYPYRRVWISIILEASVFFVVAFLLLFSGIFITIPQNLWLSINIAMAVFPLVLWLIFSWSRENFVQEPRKRLFPVVVISALVANAIGYPIVYTWIDIDSWVTQQELFDRIMLYALALGLIPEILKYLVVRYIAWLNNFRDRYDAIAYCAASAVGYAVVLNLHYVLNAASVPDVAIVRIFGITLTSLLGSLIVAYGLGAVRFEKTSPLLMPGLTAIAGFLIGLSYALRTNLANTQLSLAISFPRIIISFLLVVLLTGAIIISLIFLFDTVERETDQAQETR